ncbi:MAG: hypothetical protein H5T69_06840, partial [Chloroflexi bacterium]|nr:hypothetical protein [Chloroflexota bacterium]
MMFRSNQNGRGNARAQIERRDDGREQVAALRDRVQRRLLSELSPGIDTSDVEKLRPTLEQI